MAFGIFHKIFQFGGKRSQNSVKLELRKRQSGRPIVELLVILSLFKRCASRYSGLNSFHIRLLAVEQRIYWLP